MADIAGIKMQISDISKNIFQICNMLYEHGADITSCIQIKLLPHTSIK